jgi:hypothetical protein
VEEEEKGLQIDSMEKNVTTSQVHTRNNETLNSRQLKKEKKNTVPHVVEENIKKLRPGKRSLQS